jgi:hypothetical protein
MEGAASTMIKFQAPNPKHQISTKLQVPNSKQSSLVLGASVLGACLGFGIWDLVLSDIASL